MYTYTSRGRSLLKTFFRPFTEISAGVANSDSGLNHMLAYAEAFVIGTTCEGAGLNSTYTHWWCSAGVLMPQVCVAVFAGQLNSTVELSGAGETPLATGVPPFSGVQGAFEAAIDPQLAR